MDYRDLTGTGAEDYDPVNNRRPYGVVERHENADRTGGWIGYIDDDGEYVEEDLQMGPVTPFGTYLFGFEVEYDLEPLEEYDIGGYHPVELKSWLGAVDQPARYKVLHKLGQSDSCTVWLCRDTLVRPLKYLALKIMKAKIQEPDIMQYNLKLESIDLDAPGGEYVEVPLSKFTLKGPNGTHQCMTFQIYGHSISPAMRTEWDEARDQDASSAINRMAHNATQVSGLLAQQRHLPWRTDFRPENIRALLRAIDPLSEAEILRLFGRPREVEVRRGPREENDGIERDLSSQPKHLVHAYNSGCLARDPLPNHHVSDRIVVTGLGKAYWAETPPAWEDLKTEQGFLPPELQFGFEPAELPPNSIGFASDLWALGYTLAGIRTQKKIFQGPGQDPDRIVAEAVCHFGFDKLRKRANDNDGEPRTAPPFLVGQMGEARHLVRGVGMSPARGFPPRRRSTTSSSNILKSKRLPHALFDAMHELVTAMSSRVLLLTRDQLRTVMARMAVVVQVLQPSRDQLRTVMYWIIVPKPHDRLHRHGQDDRDDSSLAASRPDDKPPTVMDPKTAANP